MRVDHPQDLQLGPFLLSTSRRRLTKDGHDVPLTPKALDILLVLASRAGSAVEKQVLIKEVWGDVFVDESTLTQNIFTIRKALGEPSYIETIPRLGYRLTLPVAPAANSPAPAPRTAASRPHLLLALGALSLLVLAGLGYLWHWNRSSATGTIGNLRSLVVLPFVNIGDAGDEYFADGMTEETINALTNVKRLRVVARSTAFQFKGKPQDVRELGKRLNVEAVLEGSVRRQQHQLRVTAQLIRVADGTIIWSKTWDRALSDVFAVQREIAQTIAGDLGPAARRPGTANLDAYNLYLLARFHRNKVSPAAIHKAIQAYRGAIEKDPGYAAAWAGLADCYQLQGYTGLVAPKVAYPQAATAVGKALALDDSQVYALTVQSGIKLCYDRDWTAAERAITRAMAVDPADSEVHHAYSHFLLVMGRVSESLAESLRAIELDPLNSDVLSHLPFHYILAHDHEAGIAAARRSLEVDPGHFATLVYLLWHYQQTKRFDQAVETGVKLGDSPTLTASFKKALAATGERGYWQVLLDHRLPKSPRPGSYIDAYDLARLYSRLNDRDHAFEWLGRAFEDRNSWLVYLKLDPAWDNIRRDARFAELVHRVGLPE